MNKTGVITGGTKGIGKALIQEFVRMGFTIYTCSRSSEDLEILSREMKESGFENKVHGLEVNLEEKGQCLDFVEFVKSKTEHLDLLVNNAGIFFPGQIKTEEDGVLEKTIQINLYSPYYITRGLLPLVKTGKGYIFNMCSTASIVPYTNGGSYCISKFGLLGFSKVLREELKEEGIKVSSVLPGATYTESWKSSGLPEKRFMKVSDIAKIIVSAYNLSEQAVVEEILIRPQAGDI